MIDNERQPDALAPNPAVELDNADLGQVVGGATTTTQTSGDKVSQHDIPITKRIDP
ncbi:MAG TPA: hypothetical protein VHN39_00785 [Phenylobacterium sp.]|jgi:hypothetical protein|nr:hypothetical protein [Phenylobacterium sp.]